MATFDAPTTTGVLSYVLARVLARRAATDDDDGVLGRGRSSGGWVGSIVRSFAVARPRVENKIAW